MTPGEDLFLDLYSLLAKDVSVRAGRGAELDFLLNAEGFSAFVRLSATLEVFLRYIRAARGAYAELAHLPATEFVKRLRQELDMPRHLLDNKRFCETFKLAGEVASARTRSRGIENSVIKTEPKNCIWCDVGFGDDKLAARTIEHMWPLSLGGATVVENLVLACNDCNSKRSDMISWAAGPVQATFHVRSSKNEKNPRDTLQFSMSLARLTSAARATAKRRHLLTLKEAATNIRPLVPQLQLIHDRPYLYFELLEHIEAQP